MDHLPPHHFPESEPHPEQSIVDLLPEALGYVETNDLTELAGELVEAMRSDAETKDLATRYLERAEVIAAEATDERARLGLEIRLALLRRAGGRTEAYLEDIEIAAVHAFYMGLDQVASILEAELP